MGIKTIKIYKYEFNNWGPIRRFIRWRFKRKFIKFYWKKINWTEKEMWEHTAYSASLNDAITTLTYKALELFLCSDKEKKILYMTAKRLITKRYQDMWVKI